MTKETVADADHKQIIVDLIRENCRLKNKIVGLEKSLAEENRRRQLVSTELIEAKEKLAEIQEEK